MNKAENNREKIVIYKICKIVFLGTWKSLYHLGRQNVYLQGSTSHGILRVILINMVSKFCQLQGKNCRILAKFDPPVKILRVKSSL
jgi:hypothetical protein